MNWEHANQRIDILLEGDSTTYRNNRASLHQIVRWAADWRLDPADFMRMSSTCMREIIFECKMAIRENNDKKLQELFHMGATMTVNNLRRALRGYLTETIPYEGLVDSHGVRLCKVTFTERQFRRVKTLIEGHVLMTLREQVPDEQPR